MEMKKILVPIDGSEPSKNAFKLALALASKWTAKSSFSMLLMSMK